MSDNQSRGSSSRAENLPSIPLPKKRKTVAPSLSSTLNNVANSRSGRSVSSSSQRQFAFALPSREEIHRTPSRNISGRSPLSSPMLSKLTSSGGGPSRITAADPRDRLYGELTAMQSILPNPRARASKTPQATINSQARGYQSDIDDDDSLPNRKTGSYRKKVAKSTRPPMALHKTRKTEIDYIAVAPKRSEYGSGIFSVRLREIGGHAVQDSTKTARSARKTLEEPYVDEPRRSETFSNDELSDITHSSDGDLSTSEDERTHGPNDMETSFPFPELLVALEELILAPAIVQKAGRLPFLRRNLSRSLERLGIGLLSQTQYADAPIVKVTYIFGQLSYTGKSKGWKCPLCKIFGNVPFSDQKGLLSHLEQGHRGCESLVSEDPNDPCVRIIIPDVPVSESESDEQDQIVEGITTEDANTHITFFERIQTPEQEDKPFLRGPSVARSTFTRSPMKAPMSPPSSPVLAPQPQPINIVTRPPRPIDPVTPDRYPTPPPYEDLLGPSAVYPYLPDHMYSARPGGPKIYDLLNELPLEPFGLMAWYILDKEEDIFELDTVRDEDKVMQALWSRWILLHRKDFIEDYKKGTQAFITEYWRMIHRAAGFSALRVWLLMLVSNRFLTGPEMCDLLKFYSNLIGMDLWEPAPAN